MTAANLKPRKGEVLILRCCRADGTSRNGFAWPASGKVSAPDWDPTPACGQGLHGWLRGVGDPDCWSRHDSDLWIIAAAKEAEIVDLIGKVKFPSCRILFRGPKAGAINIMCACYPTEPILFGTATAGDYGTATAGYGGTATAGARGTATAGHGGTATAGARGTATAGYGGTANAGDGGTANAGNYGTANAGYGGTATAGDGGIISVRHWDAACNRPRVIIGYVGENGLKPNTSYRLNAQSEFFEVERGGK